MRNDSRIDARRRSKNHSIQSGRARRHALTSRQCTMCKNFEAQPKCSVWIGLARFGDRACAAWRDASRVLAATSSLESKRPRVSTRFFAGEMPLPAAVRVWLGDEHLVNADHAVLEGVGAPW